MTLAVTGSVAAQQLAQTLVGAGVTISNVTYTGNALQAGTFSGGLSAGGIDQTGGTGIGFDTGIVLSSGKAADNAAPQSGQENDTVFNGPGDTFLTSTTGAPTHDAAVLQFDFNPGDATQVYFNFVFGTDEYPSSPSFNDGFAILVNGTNVALIPGDSTPVQISNFSKPINKVYYKEAASVAQSSGNPGGFPTQVINAQIQSMSVPLQAVATVLPNQINHIKFAIADSGDSAVDSFVFVQGGSLSTTPVSTVTVPAPTFVLGFESDSGMQGDNATNVTLPAFTGSGVAGDTVALFDAGTQVGSVTVGLDGTWSLTPNSAFPAGIHTLTATQTDVSGNVSPPSAPLSLTVDVTAPGAPTALILNVSSDSGLIGDNLTKVTQPTIVGTGQANSTIKLYDGVTLVGTGTADGEGAWTITVTAALSQGSHSLTATATDLAGNVSEASAALMVTLDSISPNVPGVLGLTTISDTGVSTVDGITRNSKPTLVGSAEAGSTVQLTTVYTNALGNVTNFVNTLTADELGVWSETSIVPEPDGSYSVTATAVDAAGNVSAPSSPFVVVIDTLSPSSTSQLTLAPASDSGTVGDNITNLIIPAITGTGTAGDFVALFDGATQVGFVTVALDGTWSLAPTMPLTSGIHTLTATQTDVAGNVSPVSASLAILIDTGAPEAPSAPMLVPASDSGLQGDNITRFTTPLITGTGVAGDTVALFDGETQVGSVMVGLDGTWALAPDAALTAGSHILTTAQMDLAGNISTTSSSLTIFIDTAIPAKPASLTLAPASDSGILGDGLTNVAMPVITGTGVAGDRITLYDSDGIIPLATTIVGDTGAWTVMPAVALADGIHNLIATITDIAGNTSSYSDPLAMNIDTVIPATAADLTLASASDSGILGDGLTNVTMPVITGTGSAGDSVTLYDSDGITPIGTATVDDTGAWSITSPAALVDGAHYLTAIMTDAAGNVSLSSDALVLNVDTAIPATAVDLALAPSSDSGTLGDRLTNVTMPTITGTGMAGDMITLYDSNGVDLIGTTTVDDAGAWSVTPIIALADGAHNLTATTIDAAGNASLPSDALVLNIDTSVPAKVSGLTLAPASDTGILGDGLTNVALPMIKGTGQPGATLTLYDGNNSVGTAVVDDDGTWVVTPGPLTNGLHNLTAKQTDVAGNTSPISDSLSFILDTIAPAVSAPTLTVVRNAGATPLSIAAPTDPNFFANQLTITVGALPSDGTLTLADGTTAITAGQVLTSAQLVGLLFTPTIGLSGVSSDFTYVVSNPAGSASVAAITLSVGTLSPIFTTVGEIVNDAGTIITGKAVLGSTVTLFSNAVAIGSGMADESTGIFAITPSTPLALGLNTLSTTTTSENGTSTPSAFLDIFNLQRPVFGVSTTDFSSADIGAAIRQGANLAFIGGTETVLLTDSTLSIGLDTNEATIQRLYEGLLTRSNDTGGISFYNDKLIAGASKTTVATSFLESPEYVALHGVQSDDQFVTSLYQGLLGRAPEPGATANWTTQLAQGTSRGGVTIGIADSEEAKLHLASATTHVYVQNAAGTLAHELYETGLGREVELAVLPYYRASYALNSPAQIASEIAASTEFMGVHAGQDNNAYVNSLYEAGLGRPADPVGLAAWTTLLETGGASRSDVLLGFATSSEGAAHLTNNLSALLG